MEKLIFMKILGLFILGSCSGKSSDNHEGHNHGTEVHDHNRGGGDHNHEGEDHEGYDHEGEEYSQGTKPVAGYNGKITLPKAEAEAAGVKTGVIALKALEQVIKTSEQVLAAQGDESVAVATVASVVSFCGRVTEGMSAGKGTALVTIPSSNITDGDPMQCARVAYGISKKEYGLIQALVKNETVSGKEFTQAERNYEDVHTSYEVLARNHSAGGQAVVSPISGFVESILVKEGDYVIIDQPLINVTQNRRLFLRTEISEGYCPLLRTIGSANFKTLYGDRVYGLKGLDGRLLSFDKSAGDNSFYIPVTLEFDNKGDIIPSSFVEVYLLSSPTENVISLPHTILTEEQDLFFAYLQLDEEGYKKQKVTLGADSGKSVQTLSGIKAGGWVATQGVYQVKLVSASNTVPIRSHEH